MHSRFSGIVLVSLLAISLLLASCSTTPSTPSSSGTSEISTKPYGSLAIAPNFFSATILNTTGNGWTSGNTFRAILAGVFDLSRG